MWKTGRIQSSRNQNGDRLITLREFENLQSVSGRCSLTAKLVLCLGVFLALNSFANIENANTKNMNYFPVGNMTDFQLPPPWSIQSARRRSHIVSRI